MRYLFALLGCLWVVAQAHPHGGVTGSNTLQQPLGMNLSQVAYYSPELPFLNIMKQGGSSSSYGPWYTTANGSTDSGEEVCLASVLDSNSYPTTLTTGCSGQSFTTIFTLLNFNLPATPPGATSCYQGGTYRLKYEGKGTVTISGSDGSATLSNSAANTYVSTTFTVTPTCTGSTGVGLHLNITAIGSNTDYPRDISVVLNTYAAAYDGGAIFYPPFLTMLAPFASIRFMQWENMNGEFYPNYNVSNTSFSIGATGATLTAGWTQPTGTYEIVFIDGETRNATFTFGSTAVTWTTGLANALSSASNWLWGTQSFYAPFFQVAKKWSTRSLPSNAFWDGADGVPVEIMVALCNTLNVNCYTNIPLLYSDADITAVGQMVMSGTGMQSGYSALKSALTWSPELSNEVWNTGNYSQGAISGAMGYQAFCAPTAPGSCTNTPGGGNGAWEQNWLGMRTAQMATDLNTAVGSTLFARVIPILGVWQASTLYATWALTTPYWTSGPADTFPIKQAAMAPYWANLSSGDCTTMLTTAKPLDDFFATVTGNTGTAANGNHVYSSAGSTGVAGYAEYNIGQFVTLMASYPQKLIAYEGGQNYVPNSLCTGWNALVTSAERDPRMGIQTFNFLNYWASQNGTPNASTNIFNYYQDVSDLGSSSAFGVLESTMQTISPLSVAPAKYNAVVSYVGQ